jgi:hypothetical protein
MNLGRGKNPRSGVREKFIPDPDPWGKNAPDSRSGSESATLVPVPVLHERNFTGRCENKDGLQSLKRNQLPVFADQ